MTFMFHDFERLIGDEIELKINEKVPANEERGYVPAYKFNIVLKSTSEVIGNIDIRIGNNENLYF